MTRLNLVPPAELMDQHLFAEFREIKMVPKSLARSLAAAERRGAPDPVAEVLRRAPKEFTLNTGHVSFFYDKGDYLIMRYSDLRRELWVRGVNYNEAALMDEARVFERDDRLRNFYTPTPAALAVIRERIALRIAARPGWYRHSNTAARLAHITTTAEGCNCGQH